MAADAAAVNKKVAMEGVKGKPAGAMENKAEAAAAGIKGKPAGAVKKTTKVRVPQGYIETLLADPPRAVCPTASLKRSCSVPRVPGGTGNARRHCQSGSLVQGRG